MGSDVSSHLIPLRLSNFTLAVAPRVVYEPLQRDERNDGIRITNTQLLGVIAGLLLIGEKCFAANLGKTPLSFPFMQLLSQAPSKCRSFNKRYLVFSTENRS